MDLKVSFPSEIMIELTNHCNNRCFFCSSIVSNRKRGYIDAKLAKKLINDAYDLGCRKISFHGMGEPFLCSELAEYVRDAKNLGYEYVYLDSNGVLAGEGHVEDVLDAGLDSLKLSIHAASKETYKKITGRDKLEKVMSNGKYISEYINEHNLSCKTIAYFAVSKINQHEVDAFQKQWGGVFQEVWIKPIHNGSGLKTDNKIYSVDEASFAATKELPCNELYSRIVINWEGKAIACSTDWMGSLVYGDADVEALDKLWNNERINELRKKHQDYSTLPLICSNCMGIEI